MQTSFLSGLYQGSRRQLCCHHLHQPYILRAVDILTEVKLKPKRSFWGRDGGGWDLWASSPFVGRTNVMRVVSCSFKLLNVTAEVAHDTFCICGILLSILLDILLNRSHNIQTYSTHSSPNFQRAFHFRISYKLVFIHPSLCVSLSYSKCLRIKILLNLQEPCVLYKGRAYRYPPDVAFYKFFLHI
jgi:hypothetical protein